MSEPWLPGGASLDDFVTRIHGQIASFAEEHGLAQAKVEIELHDGGTHVLDKISAEPGYGFVTLSPYRDDGLVEEMIVPVASIAAVKMSPMEEHPPFGFTRPAKE